MKLNEELAVLTALQKLVKARLDAVRGEADEAMLAAYDDDGVTKKALKVGGVRVGDHLLTLSKAGWEVGDRDAFEEFALAYGFASIERSIRPEHMGAVVDRVAEEMPEAIAESVKLDPNWRGYVENVGGAPVFMDSGLPVPGLVRTEQKPTGSQVRGCDPKDVAPILQQLGGVDALLLGSAAEDENYDSKEN